MIAKQYLITGLITGFIGIAMSLLFMQLVRRRIFSVFQAIGKWPDGVMDADIYLALAPSTEHLWSFLY